jgi:hypothetical protein
MPERAFIREFERDCSEVCAICEFAFNKKSLTSLPVSAYYRGRKEVSSRFSVCGGCINDRCVREWLEREFLVGGEFLGDLAIVHKSRDPMHLGGWGPLLTFDTPVEPQHAVDSTWTCHCAHCRGHQALADILASHALTDSTKLRDVPRVGEMKHYVLRHVKSDGGGGAGAVDTLVCIGEDAPERLPGHMLPGSRRPRHLSIAAIREVYGPDHCLWPVRVVSLFPEFAAEERCAAAFHNLIAAVFAESSVSVCMVRLEKAVQSARKFPYSRTVQQVEQFFRDVDWPNSRHAVNMRYCPITQENERRRKRKADEAENERRSRLPWVLRWR